MKMLEIDFRAVKNVGILDLSGDINIDASNFIERVAWCLENGYKDIICNFENINLIDYAGLSVISIGYKNIVNHKGRVKFVKVAAHIQKIFALVCLDRVFEIYETEELAINSFAEDKIIAEIQKKQLRRRFKRLPLDIDVQFKSAKEETFCHGKVLNLSAVGVMVFTDKKAYPLGEIMDLKLMLMPKPGTLELKAKVAWLVEKELQPHIYPGMGMEFYQLDTETQKKIVQFVERNLPLDGSSCS